MAEAPILVHGSRRRLRPRPYDPLHPASGPTCSCNLAPLCRRHHRLKTHGGGTYVQVERGTYLWTSPHGLSSVRATTAPPMSPATGPPAPARTRRTHPHVIESDEGSIRIRGRAGLDVTYRGEEVRVSSEMLAPAMTIALFTRGQDAPASERAGEILEFVVAGLEFAGFTVERD